MCCTVRDSDCTWSLRALMLKSKSFCARASLLTDARRLASSPLIRVRGGSAGELAGVPGTGAVMVENLGLVGEESFAAIGANGKWQRRRREFRRRWFAEGQGLIRVRRLRRRFRRRGSGFRATVEDGAW